MFFVFDDGDNRYEGMTKEEILATMQQALTQGYVSDPDGAVFSKIKEINANGTAQIWIGTEAEFNALAPSTDKTIIRMGADGTLYLCKDDSTLDNFHVTSTMQSATLSASGWAGSSAPYSLNISVSGVTATSPVEVIPSESISAAQLEALQGANIIGGGQTTGRITLKAFGDKPSIDIPVTIIVRGDM